MTQPERSPLARLVLFMICLSLLGALVAGGWCYAAGLSYQDIRPPLNSGDSQQCVHECASQYCIDKPAIFQMVCYTQAVATCIPVCQNP